MTQSQIEKNRKQIDTNKLHILVLRGLLVLFAIALVVMNDILNTKIEVSMHEAEERLYEKITGQKAPSLQELDIITKKDK